MTDTEPFLLKDISLKHLCYYYNEGLQGGNCTFKKIAKYYVKLWIKLSCWLERICDSMIMEEVKLSKHLPILDQWYMYTEITLECTLESVS